MSSKRAWSVWVRSVVRALISGFFGGVVNGLAAVGIKPEVFNFDQGLSDLLKLAGAAGLISAILGVAMYLQRSPLPDDDEERRGLEIPPVRKTE
jgi:hypothetical protein